MHKKTKPLPNKFSVTNKKTGKGVMFTRKPPYKKVPGAKFASAKGKKA